MKDTPFTRALKRYRKSRKLTQVEAAKALGLPLRTLEKYEQGASRPVRALRNAIMAQILPKEEPTHAR